MMEDNKLESIVLGGGCFWCLEAIYLRVKGVISVVSGYAGGELSNESPSYEQVCTGKTGHAEVVKINFNSRIVSLEDILHIFFSVHDPTTLNRQGSDIGNQYLSIILYSDSKQRAAAEKVMREIAESRIYGNAMLVTELKKLENFYLAEEYHQKYFQKNPQSAYCQLIVAPKVAKFREKFHEFFVE